MYYWLLIFHSITRWLVLISLLYTVFRAYRGYKSNLTFTKADQLLRQLTVTCAHIQFTIGAILYFNSPVVKPLFSNFTESVRYGQIAFFGIAHVLLMTASVAFITSGSALSKIKVGDKEKFKTILLWFSIALLIILIAIPWPFSPLANRPYYRGI